MGRPVIINQQLELASVEYVRPAARSIPDDTLCCRLDWVHDHILSSVKTDAKRTRTRMYFRALIIYSVQFQLLDHKIQQQKSTRKRVMCMK